jgi:hypothetical protein
MNYHKAFLLSIILLTAGIIFTACSSDISILPTQPESASTFPAFKGNGAPSGAHYNLNIIGVPRDKTADMDNNNGHRIFVKLDGKTKILLKEGEDFQVLDANGTDGNGAKFQLPDPDPEDDLVLCYSVFARALGKPGGKSYTNTCFEDTLGNTYCSVDTLKLERKKGKSTFTNVSKELLTLYLDVDGDGSLERVGLFDDKAWQYFWDYDNQGLKLAQLRFYPIETDLSGK